MFIPHYPRVPTSVRQAGRRRAGWSPGQLCWRSFILTDVQQHHPSQHSAHLTRLLYLIFSGWLLYYFLFWKIVSSINIFLCSLGSFFVDNESWGRRDGKYFEEITNIDKKINTSRKCRNVGAEQLKIFFVRLTIPAGRI